MTGMKNTKADKFPEFIPPTLDHLERKLQILPNEWYIESMFKNEEVAALYAHWQPTQGPFLIVPSLYKEDLVADFTLTIFSSNPVEVKKLEEPFAVRGRLITSRPGSVFVRLAGAGS